MNRAFNGTSAANSAAQKKSRPLKDFGLVDNRKAAILQRKLQEIANSHTRMIATNFDIQPNKTMQLALDKKDLEAIIANIGDDEWLSSIVTELFEIYDEHQATINYGTSSQGGAVGFKDYAPFITIVKDKNFWKEDKIKRQSTILHELTHLAQVKSLKGKLGLDPKDEIEGYEEMNPQEQYGAAATKVAEWMTPELDYTDKISGWLDSWGEFEIPKKNKGYIQERLKYALLKTFEQPTTMVDLYYYMKSMGLTNNQLYEEIKLAAYTFYQARRGYMPI